MYIPMIINKITHRVTNRLTDGQSEFKSHVIEIFIENKNSRTLNSIWKKSHFPPIALRTDRESLHRVFTENFSSLSLKAAEISLFHQGSKGIRQLQINWWKTQCRLQFVVEMFGQTQLNEPTKQNSIEVTKIVEPKNKKILL